MNAIFVYKKDDDVIVYNLEESLKKEAETLAQGYKHIATLDPETLIKCIYGIIQAPYSAGERCEEITQLLIP